MLPPPRRSGACASQRTWWLVSRPHTAILFLTSSILNLEAILSYSCSIFSPVIVVFILYRHGNVFFPGRVSRRVHDSGIVPRRDQPAIRTHQHPSGIHPYLGSVSSETWKSCHTYGQVKNPCNLMKNMDRRHAQQVTWSLRAMDMWANHMTF